MNGILVNGTIPYIQTLHCGYCGGIESPNGKSNEKTWALDHLIQSGRCPASSFGFQTAGMITEAYQILIDRGWRRSGSYIYRNDMLRSCCRHYTIRTSLEDLMDGFYKKEHRHSLNRFYKFMNGDIKSNPKLGLLDKFIECETVKQSQFTSVLSPAEFSEKKFELFKKYQISIHHESEEEQTPESFDRFLCTNPFLDTADDLDWNQMNSEWSKRECGEALKSFQGPLHECYYHITESGEAKLIAMAVLDILDHAISSIYFIYDPDYSHLGLGTVSALREICMSEIMKRKWYYLGYFIPDCDKMKYKGKFGGEILDLGHYKSNGDNDNKWWKLKDIGSILSDGKFHTFESINGKVVDRTNELYGPKGKYWNFPIETKSNIPGFGPLWNTMEIEQSFIQPNLRKSKVDKVGPQIVPGCHLFGPKINEYLAFLQESVQRVRILDYEKMAWVEDAPEPLATNQFQINRVIGPKVPLTILI